MAMVASDGKVAPASVPLRALPALLIAFFALNNVLLLGFLGQPPVLVAALAVTVPPLLGFLAYRMTPSQCRVDLSTILICFLVAAILLMLGGEGRLFYATPDWQVRDALLADMGGHRWPFDYWLDGRSQIMRAPIGMYLIPALLGGVSQFARDWILFAQNSLVLSLLFALGSALFEGRPAKWIAIAVFVAFSGLDVLGTLVAQWAAGKARWDHIEDWAAGYQYSAHITQLFWAPQHAFAGWAAAVTYILWRRKLIPVGMFCAILPLAALWSPLILFGAVPYTLFVWFQTLRTRSLNGSDFLLCLIAIAVSAPALVYLSTASASVGGGLRVPNLILYVLIILFEVAPFLFPVLLDRKNGVDRSSLGISAACLLLMPSWSIGMFNDFQTRASIMPLAILAVAYADWATGITAWRKKVSFGTVIVLGSVTGVIGIANAIRFEPSPVPHCSVSGVWDRQSTLHYPHSSYFAAREAFPFSILPTERVSSANPDRCWDRPWRMPARFLTEGRSQS